MFESTQLHANDVGFAYGPRQLLSAISLTLAPGDRMGVVGPNGTGKSTLLRLLAGELEPNTGTIKTSPPTATVGLMQQQLLDEPG